LFVGKSPQRRFIGGAGGHYRRLAGKIAIGPHGRSFRDHQLGAGDEKNRRESDFLLALHVAGGRAALQVDCPGFHLLQSVGGGYGAERDLDVHTV